MSPPLLSTRMIKSILHHTLCLGHSQRHCAQALGVSKGVVAKYLAAAAAADLDWAVIEPLSETELEQRLVPARVGAATPVVPDYAAIHRELSRKGVTPTDPRTVARAETPGHGRRLAAPDRAARRDRLALRATPGPAGATGMRSPSRTPLRAAIAAGPPEVSPGGH